ncbi:hypothetical protein [Photobacterium lipolyticum]|uniref:Uncharacterized protein n=1 Tax=Photobacterium lipolyticum TaxID=266810 RepID=A0A2T3MYQ9_9GAMM|nr:hypothetical protein [Photobacterium lipolyticum]PSW05088.1 hypothetical protein C9I89_09850 [Photobacterium lipolyticum]
MQCNHYQPTAYTKQKCPLVSQPIDMGVLEHVMIDSQLAWYSQYNYLNPRQKQFSAGWLKRYRVQKKDFPDYWFLSHQVFKTGWDEDKSQQSDKMFTEMFIGCFSFPLAWLWIGSAWIGFLASIIGGDAFWEFFFYPPIVCGIFTWLNIRVKESNLRYYKRDKWNGQGFFRETGKVVTQFGEFDFTDFDPVIERNMMANGTCNFNLEMRYRYREQYKFSLPIYGAGSNIRDAHAAWDMLLRFMDIEEPLPDIPELEPFRHLDPTTVEYDQTGKRGRPDNYWHDLYAANDESTFWDYLHDMEGRKKNNPLIQMESDFCAMIRGNKEPVPPYIPEHIYEQRKREFYEMQAAYEAEQQQAE